MSIGFASFVSTGQLIKERICSYRSKFSPLRVDPISKSLLNNYITFGKEEEGRLLGLIPYFIKVTGKQLCNFDL